MKKPTITVGIPAFNEEGNIENLVNSVLFQNQVNFKLVKILIVLDGSTDKTLSIVKKLQKHNKIIHLKSFAKRGGKMRCLNYIYKNVKTDYLFTLDADVLLPTKDVISNLIIEFHKNRKLNAVAAYDIPVKPVSFLEKINFAGNELWDDIRLHVNNGNCIHNLRGSGTCMKKVFYKNLKHPKQITTDQGYVYLKAVEKNHAGFAHCKNAKIIFRPPNTLHDIRLQGNRAIFEDKKTLANYFGNYVYRLYRIPTNIKIKYLFKRIFLNPFYTFLCLLLWVCIRVFRYYDIASVNGTWTIVKSTKIKINQY